MLHAALRPSQRSLPIGAQPLPGIGLCLAITGLACLLERAEEMVLGRAWLETLNLALLAGVAFRALYVPGPVWTPGIRYCSRTLLNIAIVLLGASFSVDVVFSVGPWVLAAVAGVVAFSLVFTCCIGRMVGLDRRQTLLVACGNSICGNSAIMAAAPVIRAGEEDVATTIAFTAAGGLVVVIGIPLLAPFVVTDHMAQGVLAGLTVYAVPQVVAATAPFGAGAIHMGMLVKLVRVLMLGPVCVTLSALSARSGTGSRHHGNRLHALTRLVPWYITGFMVMMAVRSLHLIPAPAVGIFSTAATALTVLAMAALGLGVDIRSVVRAGRPLVLTVLLSLCGLMGISLLLVRTAFHG
ncbi:YeiH family protein [Komagataeibacter sp. FXV3]|uniref:YeiH family protein n=1 Tax=Komagataeibacter sp. FXV3 TaxID=2608998 RepID=UPI00187B4527|nr:putative sulfate exporter family transporter [Komagataeibacter sp. FXV3]MBE7728700.1 putative sulfate exporter family transporter [Komagataeibacter sp. FXV3]